MLASDSDSDFEYPADGNNSEASDDLALLGKLALGIDPTDMKVYDGKSTPRNGSQYLMKVIAEKRVVPKVVSVDAATLEGKIKGGKGAGGPHYLDRFLQACSSSDDVVKGNSESVSYLPSSKWREETTSCFSMIRSKVEKWQYKMEAKEIRIIEPVMMPQNNDNTHWLKFCFGEGFAKLALSLKKKGKEERLSDFFLDLYERSVNESLVKSPREGPESPPQDSEDNPEVKSETLDESQSVHDETITEEAVASTPDPIIQLGNRPLMNLVLQLNQNQLENLVKWNLLWVQNFGLVNECQGQWLYAVLACLFKPVDPSVMSDLRSIVRILIKIRNKFSDEWGLGFGVRENSSDVKEVDDIKLNDRVFDFINTLNLFIYLIADYFQQKDLVMHL